MPQQQPASIITRPLLSGLGIALPFLLHAILLYLYAVNAPRLDDFPEILTFLPDWHAATSTNEKLAILFRDYQNHRYVLYHALLVLFDHVNFRTATLAGNLALPALAALMLLTTRHHPQRNTIWLVTPLLLCNLQSWRAMFWGPLGTTNLLYPAAALLACWLATRGNRGVLAAGIVAVLLTLSHGSGPLLFPVIAVYLGHKYLWQQRTQSPRSFAGWLLLSTIVFWLYFFVFPLQREAGYSSHSSAELLQNLLLHSGDILRGFLALCGSLLLYNDASEPWRETLATVLGSGELLWLGWLLQRGALRQYPALLLWLAFLLLTVASIASGRVAYAGIAQAMQGHYKLLNGILLWLLVVANLQWLHDKQPGWRPTGERSALVLSLLLYCAALLLFYQPMTSLQLALQEDARQFSASGKLQYIETRLYVQQPNRKIKAAIEGGFYNPGE